MYIIYINTKGGNRYEMAREQGNTFKTDADNVREIIYRHAANYRSNVTVSISKSEFGLIEREMQGTKGW